MNTTQSGVTGTTSEKVKRWIAAKAATKRAKAELNGREIELVQATNDLGNWICPDDRKVNEEFCIWYGSGLLRAKLTGTMENGYTVDWRKEPDAKQATEEGI